MNLKHEILDNLPNPRDIDLPNYFEKTITEEKLASGLSDEEIEEGYSNLIESYSNLKNKGQKPPDYSEPKVYIAYLVKYLRDYYPRMYFIMNHLLRYTNFFRILDSWNREQIKILDIGAGPGTMCFAFIEYLEYINQLKMYNFEYYIKIIEREENFTNFIHKLEANIEMLNENLKNNLIVEKPIRCTKIDFDNIEESLNNILGEESYNVIILSFILNENDPQKEKNIKLFKILSRHLDNEGIIIYIGAASYYLYEYFEFDFEKEIGLIRIAPCLNGNKTYGNKFPFFSPCGDLCTFQLHEGEVHKFCYLILSSKDLLIKNFDENLQKSVELFNQFDYMLNMTRQERIEKLEELGDIYTNFFGLYSNNRDYDHYFCNGVCKFKINSFPNQDLKLDEGFMVDLKDIIFDGEYPKPHKRGITKNYAEIAFKYNKDRSKIEIIDNFHIDTI